MMVELVLDMKFWASQKAKIDLQKSKIVKIRVARRLLAVSVGSST